MLYALLGLSAAGNAGLVLAFLRHLRASEDLNRRERGHLLNRIQAPHVAVAQSSTEDAPASTAPLFVPFDDDQAYHDLTRKDQ